MCEEEKEKEEIRRDSGKKTRRRITSGGRDCAESVEFDKTNFSEQAIANLSANLNNTQPNSRNTQVSFFNLYSDLQSVATNCPSEDGVMWVELAATDCGCLSFSRMDLDMMKSPNHPAELLGLTNFGCTVWNCNIVIVGGICLRKEEEKYHPYGSDKVFMYDPVLKQWRLLPDMNIKRGGAPIVVGVDDAIFVFGGGDESSEATTDSHYYAEYYREDASTGSGRWSWVTTNPPLSMSDNISVAVCPNQNLVLFWVGESGVVSFNYKTWKWEEFQHGSSFSHFPQWNRKVLVIEDFIFWNSTTTVFAHDLCAHITLPVCNLPITSSGHLDGKFVRLGTSTLCLFGKADATTIWYVTFLLQISRGVESTTLHLALERTGVLETPCLGISNLISNIKDAI